MIEVDEAIHQVLAEKIFADRDIPPVDRVTMDGIAIRFDSWSAGQTTFQIEDMQAAGVPIKRLRNGLNCIEVMTGTGIPDDTDTVIPYEEVSIVNGMAMIAATSVAKGQNIHKRGSDASRNELLLSPGLLLSAAEIALLASIGKSMVQVFDFPPTAIISSGDELVSIESIPGDHQVRRSNSYALQAAMRAMGWEGTIFHLPDNEAEMTSIMREIASAFKVMILSGGVSKGKFDFVPAVMKNIGISKLFHRVNQRPGKPFWFGSSSEGHIVFALPGNPVSTYMCFYRYIKPWILHSLGVESFATEARLAQDFVPPNGMTYFLQVRVRNEGGTLVAYPDPGGGSGDFANLKRVTGFLELHEGRSSYSKGDPFPYYSFRIDR